MLSLPRMPKSQHWSTWTSLKILVKFNISKKLKHRMSSKKPKKFSRKSRMSSKKLKKFSKKSMRPLKQNKKETLFKMPLMRLKNLNRSTTKWTTLSSKKSNKKSRKLKWIQWLTCKCQKTKSMTWPVKSYWWRTKLWVKSHHKWTSMNSLKIQSMRRTWKETLLNRSTSRMTMPLIQVQELTASRTKKVILLILIMMRISILSLSEP
jgi:hypothetical protein